MLRYFSELVLVMFIFFLVIGIPILVILGNIRKNQALLDSWPTLEDYLAKYPQCQTRNGIKCCYCHSRGFWNSVVSRNPPITAVVCKTCGKNLYAIKKGY